MSEESQQKGNLEKEKDDDAVYLQFPLSPELYERAKRELAELEDMKKSPAKKEPNINSTLQNSFPKEWKIIRKIKLQDREPEYFYTLSLSNPRSGNDHS